MCSGCQPGDHSPLRGLNKDQGGRQHDLFKKHGEKIQHCSSYGGAVVNFEFLQFIDVFFFHMISVYFNCELKVGFFLKILN